jgi:hypothetical protein
MTTSVFEKHVPRILKHRYAGSLLVHHLVGGTPSDPKVAEGWIRSKLDSTDALVQDAVAEIMEERGLESSEAAAELARRKHLNGFRRDDSGLYIEGRCLKACLKEAGGILISNLWAKRKWGSTSKGTLSFLPEHLSIDEDRLYLGVTEPTGVDQRFISTFRGTGIQLEEYVDDAKISFTLSTDYDFSDDDWGDLWVTAERQVGLGASRSQGFGKFVVTSWEKI